MEEAPENGKESSHSAHGNGMNEVTNYKHNFIINYIILYKLQTQLHNKLLYTIQTTNTTSQ